MHDAVLPLAPSHDVFVATAAVADWRPASLSEQKIKKSERNLSLELVPNTDILAYVAGLPQPPFCVGFAAESEKLAEHAEDKRKRKKLPLLAANLAQQAIGADDNEVTLFDDDGAHPLPRASKERVAHQLVAHISSLYRRKQRSR